MDPDRLTRSLKRRIPAGSERTCPGELVAPDSPDLEVTRIFKGQTKVFFTREDREAWEASRGEGGCQAGAS